LASGQDFLDGNSHVATVLFSDIRRFTSLAEAMNLHGLKVLDNLALLKAWCETTAETIFPGRKIGRLQEGYEASFLVLGGNPLRDFENVKDIRMRFKQGRFIQMDQSSPAPATTSGVREIAMP